MTTRSGVGRYVGIEHDGHGEIAFDPQLDREVLLERSDAVDAAGVSALKGKSRALATVAHPSIMRVHDVVVGEDGVARVVVERPRGVTLVRWLESRPTLARRLGVLLAVAEGLLAVHSAGIVHGAVDDAAIMVDCDDGIRIIALLRRASGGSVEDDRRGFCALALGMSGDELRRVPRHRALLAALRQAAGPGDTPTLAALAVRLAAAKRSPRRLEAALALSAVAALGWVAARPTEHALSPAEHALSWCDDIERRHHAVWNPEVRAQVRSSLLATGVAYAEPAADAVLADLDAFAARWHRLQLVRCSSGTEGGAVAVCLYRKFDGLRTLVDSLRTVDAETIAHAVDAVVALGSPDECTEGGAALLAIAADAALTEEIRTDLVAAESLRELGRYDEARAAAERAVAAASAAGSDAALAEAQCLLAQAMFALGHEADAERLYHASFTTALAAGHDAVVARAAAELALTLARRGDLDAAETWREHALGAGARVLEPRLKGRVAAVSARLSLERAAFPDAILGYGRALEMAEQTEPLDVAAVLHARQGLAIAHGRNGDLAFALALLERNVDDTEARYGAQHPDLGRQINSVATELVALGRTNDAVVQRRRGVDILVRALGSTHADSLAARGALATDLAQTGEREPARMELRELVADAEVALGRDDPRTIGHVAELGMVEALLDHTDDAIAHLADAAARAESRFGPEHADTLGILTNLAATHMFAEHHDEARARYDEIIARTERGYGADHPRLVPVLLGAARTRRETDDRDGAIAMLERARTIMEAHVERPDRIATVDFDLAELLWDRPAARGRAVALARGALVKYGDAHARGLVSAADSAERVTQWLETHANP